MGMSLTPLLILASLSIYAAELAEIHGTDPTVRQMSFDIDADGTDELITVLFTDHNTVQVVVSEPALDDDLFPAVAFEIEEFALSADIELLGPSVAGVPLLKISTSREACGEYSVTYLSYSAKEAKVGTLRPALHLVGLSDPPQWSSFKVVFEPMRKAAVVSWDHAAEIGEGPAVTHTTEHHRYELTEDGVFARVQP